MRVKSLLDGSSIEITHLGLPFHATLLIRAVSEVPRGLFSINLSLNQCTVFYTDIHIW